MRTVKPLCAFLAVTLFTGSARAAEVRIAVGGWHFAPTGSIADANMTYDLERDLSVEPRGQRSVQVEWDTPPGWWPDLALSWSQVGANGRHVEPGAPPVVPDTTIVSRTDADDVDLSLRYPFQLAGVELAAGLSLKYLRGDSRINDSSQAQPTSDAFNEVFPQAHLRAYWPLGDLAGFSAVGQGVSYQGNRAWEARLVAELRLFDPLLVELGWQDKHYVLDNGATALDVNLRGMLVRVGLRFQP